MAKSEHEKLVPKSFDTFPFDELRDMETDLFEAGVWRSSVDTDGKEGLPIQYKMRHDAHYVDELFSAKAARQVIRLPVNQILETANNAFAIGPLTDSIAELGVLQPLIVRRRRSRYELVAGAKRLAAAKAAGLTEVPCWLYDVDDHQARRLKEATNLLGDDSRARESSNERTLLKHVLPILGRSFQTLHSCLRQLSESGDSPVTRVANDTTQAEAQRAICLTWGAMLMSSTPKLTLSNFDAATVLDEVFHLYDIEHDLANISLTKSVQGQCSLRTDRRLVYVAVRGALDTILPLARRGRAAEVAVRLSRDDLSRTVVLQVSQEVHRPPDSSWDRWFDLQWRERPGGIEAGVGLLAAKRVTELLGGGLSILPHQGPGCKLNLSFSETTIQSAG